MIKNIDYRLRVFGIPLLMITFLLLLTRLELFQQFPNKLSIAITLDFVISIPLVYYLLIRKNKKIPNLSVASVLILCVVIAGLILPSEQQGLLSLIKTFAIPLIELGILSYLVMKTMQVIRSYRKQNQEQDLDFYDVLYTTCIQVFPNRIGKLLATEISVIYYLLFSKSKRPIEANEYTYFKKSGIKMIAGVLIGMGLVEAIVVHLLVHPKWPVLAWVLTGLSVYACLQIVALLRSMNLRLSRIDEEAGKLYLRYGFFSQTVIPFSEVVEIEKNTRSLPEDNSVVSFSPLGLLDSHNIILKLKSEQTLNGIYGIQKQYTALAIYIDEKEDFVRGIERVKG